MADYSGRLVMLPRRLWVAFAAGCAGRVLRIYELDYSDQDRAPHRAVELAWQCACGKEPSKRDLLAAREAAEKATPNIEVRGDEYSGPMRASVAAICALDATVDRTVESANDAALYALEAVGSFEDYKGKGVTAEAQWQLRALDVLEDWGDKPITRDMFLIVRDEPPSWFPWPKSSDVDPKLKSVVPPPGVPKSKPPSIEELGPRGR